MEVWKDVVGYEGIYEVSNLGNVRTHIDKVTSNTRFKKRKWKQRILKDKNPNGRDTRVTLWKDGKPKDFLVHRLVAEAFLPKVEGKTIINHIDGNPKNNNVDNLEWCDHYENNNHAFDNGLIATGKKIILRDLETGKDYEFRSMSKASEFLGKNVGFISYRISKGKMYYKNFKIVRK